ncbi:MAG TPA: hypothetical protein ENO03_07160 [Candidatus Aminicenantes bacterium]|nr:hypothetical protein [Candidatus Aminicenantes bacterium]HDT14120.1 hypothetical protein [Candidatus Aminicenantes bacterium]
MISTKKSGILILGLALLIAFGGGVACQKEAETSAEGAETEFTEFEGEVHTALGRYMYLSTAQGFDIVLPGFDAATLQDQTVKVKGDLLLDHPSIFLADSVETPAGQVLYTRDREFEAEDFIEMKVREAIPALEISGVTKPEEWEGQERGKVYGKLQRGDVDMIVLSDSRGREMAKIVVDSISTYAQYYIQKLKLFDEFWFYLDIKDTVERRQRTRTKEIFHADVIGVGLY